MPKLEKLRKELGEVHAQLKEFNGVEDITAEDVTKIEELNASYEDLKKKIEVQEKLEANLEHGSTSTRKTNNEAPKAAAGTRARTSANSDKYKGFDSFGDFLMAVKNSNHGNVDRRLHNTHFERVGEDGGFLVPDEMISEISEKVMEDDESLLSRANTFTVSGNNLSLPVDENQPWSGGIQAYWTAEGANITESKHSFKEASWKLKKLAALVKVTDELLEDATALESYVRRQAPRAIQYKVNDAIIGGSGAGQPEGILNSGFRKTVAKESGQAADTIVSANVIKMNAGLIPSARANAAWYINPECEEQLRQLQDPNGSYVYFAPGSQFNQSPYGQLMGMPVIPMVGALKQLGDEGDIVLADMSYYYAIVKSAGVQQAISTHLYFDQAVSAFRFIFRVDGSCPFQSPITTEYGNFQMSGFVTLADRA